MKVVVVGYIHAGISIAKNTLTNHPEAKITVYERNDSISFLSCGVALYVGDVIKNVVDLFYPDPEELASLGTTMKMKHNIKEIDVDDKTVAARNLQTDATETVSYDELVMTTGSWPIIPSIPGTDAENILLCKSYSRTSVIIEKTKDAGRVVVANGGYVGIKLVEALVESGKQVTLVGGLDHILNKYSGKPFTDVLERELVDRDISLTLDENVQQFVVDEQGKVAKITTPNQEFETDMVVMCIGFRPNTELLEDKVDTLSNGTIEANKYIRTGDPDIPTAGDSAVIHYNLSQIKSYIPLATNAVRQGMLVGRSLAGQESVYRGIQGTLGLYLFGRKIGSIGVTEGSAKSNGLDVEATVLEDNCRPEFMPTTKKVLVELVHEKEIQRIVGGQLVSKYGITQSANTLSLAVQNKVATEDLAISDFFFQPHFDRLWNYLNLLAQAALENT